MSEMMILGGRRPGRPASTVRKSQICATIPVDLHDRVASIAIAQRVSVSELVGRAVSLYVAGIKKAQK